MSPEWKSISQIFGAGCNARLAGLPLSACPHDDQVDAYWWRKGHMDVERFWATDVKRRWEYRNLPEVA